MKTPKIKKDRKPFKETKIGIFLKKHDSELFEFIGNRLPTDKPFSRALSILFLTLAKLTDEQKNEGESLIDLD